MEIVKLTPPPPLECICDDCIAAFVAANPLPPLNLPSVDEPTERRPLTDAEKEFIRRKNEMNTTPRPDARPFVGLHDHRK